MKRLDMNDPRLTTFALGELEGEEAIEIAKLVESDPAAKKYVEEIRETAAMLTGEFQKELNSRENIPLRLMPDEREKIFAGATAQPWWKKWQVMVPSAGLATLAVAVLAIVTRPEPQSFTEKVGTISESTDYTLEGSGALGAKTAMKVPPSSAAALDSYSQQAGAQVPAEMQNSPKADMIESSAGQAELEAAMPDQVPTEAAKAKVAPSVSVDASAQSNRFAAKKGLSNSGLSTNFGGTKNTGEVSPPAPQDTTATASDLAGFADTTARFAPPKGVAANDAMNAPIAMKKGKEIDPGFAGHQGRSSGARGSAISGNTGNNSRLAGNQFVKVQDEAVSVFPIEVGTASYSVVREMLNRYQMPSADSVQTEELLNNFKYDYPQPIGDRAFSVTTEVVQSPFSPKNKIVRIGLKGRDALKTLPQNAGETVRTIANNVKIQVEFNSRHVSSYRLIGYEGRSFSDVKGPTDNEKNGSGEIESGHAVTALYEVVLVQPGTSSANSRVPLMTVKLRYMKPVGEKEESFETPVANNSRSFDEASSDLKFASAVAGFGMLLRDSEHKGEMTYDRVIELGANNSKIAGKTDRSRLEFVELARKAKRLSPPSESE